MFISDFSYFFKTHAYQGYFDEEMHTVIVEGDKYNLGINLEISLPKTYEISPSLGTDIIMSPELFDRVKIEKTTLTQYFIDYDEVIEEDESFFQKLNGQLFFCLQIFYNLFSKIPYYEIIDVVSDPVCPGPLLSSIEIDLNALNSSEILIYYDTILQNLASKDFSVPNFVANGSKHFSRRNEIKILSTNTKSRRLGYLKIIIDFFYRSKYFPKPIFLKLIEKEVAEINDELSEYIDDKGIIKITRSGNSSKPYVDLLESLGMLTTINNSYILTKQAKPFLIISNQIINSKFLIEDERQSLFELTDKNSFRLNMFDKAYFLQQILLSDALYFWSLLDIIKVAEEPISTKSIKIYFKNYILDDLKRLKSRSHSIKEISNRIQSWKKEEVYLEHIIEPRLNWMLDLDLLSFSYSSKKGRIISLNNSGIRLHQFLSCFYERFQQKSDYIKEIVHDNFFKIITYTYMLDKKTFEINSEAIEKYMLDAFELFKTDAPRRIPASQAISYICFSFFFQNHKILEYNELKSYILRLKSQCFGIDWFKTEDDGSLFKK